MRQITGPSDPALAVVGDHRLLSVLTQLARSLDSSTNLQQLKDAVSLWAQQNVYAVDAELALAEDCRPSTVFSPSVETWREVDATALSVPTSARSVHRVVFRFREEDPSFGETPDLLLIAARLIGSAIDGPRAVELLRHDRDRTRAGSVADSPFVGSSPPAREVAALIPRLAASDVPVLLQGETGTGKSFIARLLHQDSESRRRSEPFCAINCAAIPDALFESELFGRERGAFTGAVSSEKGKLEAVGAGTLLLDEIGELSPANQAKLLRAIEERSFERVGSNRSLQLKARIVVATHRDLRDMVRKGAFREDLYYRVRNVVLRVPALRERRADIRLLAERILLDRLAVAPRRIDGFGDSALEAMDAYAWPGNVRELRAAIDRAIVLGGSVRIEAHDLPPEVAEGALAPSSRPLADTVRLPQTLDSLEQLAILHALRITKNNKSRAAELLGLKTNALYYRLRKHGVPEGDGPNRDAACAPMDLRKAH